MCILNAEPGKITEHEAIHRRISDAILFGELVPGQSVTLHGLAEMIGSGVMPVRDTVRRLTSAGALRRLENRRIEVPRLTVDELEELSFARCAIEPRLVEMAVYKQNGNLSKDLKKIDKELDKAILDGNVEGYLFHNYRFHFHLYSCAESSILLNLAEALWMRTGPSLRVVSGRYGTANLPDMHDETIAAIIEGDAARAAQAIRTDILQGLGQITTALKE
jgi:DNA-binding GntR family transcriptional regulator